MNAEICIKQSEFDTFLKALQCFGNIVSTDRHNNGNMLVVVSVEHPSALFELGRMLEYMLTLEIS